MPNTRSSRISGERGSRPRLSIPLQRLLEKGARPADPLEALREVLALGDWAAANARRMVEAGHTAKEQS